MKNQTQCPKCFEELYFNPEKRNDNNEIIVKCRFCNHKFQVKRKYIEIYNEEEKDRF